MAGREHVVRKAESNHRGRKREDPGNEVGYLLNVPSNFHVEFETENTLRCPVALDIL